MSVFVFVFVPVFKQMKLCNFIKFIRLPSTCAFCSATQLPHSWLGHVLKRFHSSLFFENEPIRHITRIKCQLIKIWGSWKWHWTSNTQSQCDVQYPKFYKRRWTKCSRFSCRLNGFEETREGQSMKQNLSLKIVTIAGELSRGRCCAICKQNRFNTKGAYRWWCPMLHCNVQQILNWMRQILDHQLNFSSNISSNKVKHIEPPFQNVGWCQISTK